MACDCHQLAVGEAILGPYCLHGLAQPVAGDALEAGFVAAIAEPISEPRHREGFAELRHQECGVAAWAAVNDLAQRGQDRQHHVVGLAAPALELGEAQHLVRADVLAAELDDVAAALTGVEEQREG